MNNTKRLFMWLLLPALLLSEFFWLATQPKLTQWLIGLVNLAMLPLGLLAAVILFIVLLKR